LEKRPHAETQAKALLYGGERQVRISGKASPDGTPLLAADQPLDAAMVAAALAERLWACVPDLETLLPGMAAVADRIGADLARRQAGPPPAFRRPAFCPGCPHSVSTKVPEGSHSGTGIGCHGMVLFHPERNPLPLGHMGAEGAAWIGLSPFTSVEHIFQNLGDGTYSHSGSLAIRAAVQAGVNITYKLLFNDAVAMTGGQPVEGGLSVARVVAQARAEGVRRVVVVAEQPDRFTGSEALPAGTELRHRDELNQVQEALRAEPGVTMLVYDQVCAAEKRRRRKAGSLPPAAQRVFINPEVCEGCGDCSVQSNCLAVQPLETELGRKRRIDQSACNADVSCLKGFCPSFVTVEGVRPRRAAGASDQGEAPPASTPRPIGEGFDLVIAGIGGTGVVTASAVLGMAARIEGLGVSLFDMTGLSQKGGQVYSHLRLRADPDAVVPARVGPGEADVLLACDLVAGVQGEALEAVAAGRTLVLANSDVGATAEFQRNRDQRLPVEAMVGRLTAAAGRSPRLIPATSLSQALLGDSIGANLMMLGAAWQSGVIPVSLAAIEEAIRLNGVAVQANLKAFAAGRRAGAGGAESPAEEVGLDDFIARRTADLTAYRNPAYAGRYAELLARVRSAADVVAGGEAFAWAVARAAYKLMAYKDEYEVARLYTDGRFKAALEREFEGGGRLKLHLSPPILARPDPRTGRPRKMAFGSWIFPALHVLASLKGLRESPLDPFGRTDERRRERQLRDLYLARAARLADALTPETLEAAVAEARAPLEVRGFGPVKAQAETALLAALRARTVDIH
jgi:indolepyruvate ferredoxin oxidoreductase